MHGSCTSTVSPGRYPLQYHPPWKPYHWGNTELYNLKDDPGEQHDLSEKNPAKAAELLDKLHSWQRNLDAKMPQSNQPQRRSANR